MRNEENIVLKKYWPTKAWNFSMPEKQGMNSSLLETMYEFTKKAMTHLRSVLVIRHGYIVYEKYNNGFSHDDLQELWSGTKSFISALIGIAINEGFLDNIERKMNEFFPEYLINDKDIFTSKVLVKHLLDMTPGFTWNSPIFHSWLKSENLVKFVLTSDMSYEPGEFYYYDDHNPHILSAIISKLANNSTAEFAEKYLFNPLGINKYKWEADSQGINCGGFGLMLTPRDMAKLGYLYLCNGLWDEKQIILPEWVKASTCKQSIGGPPENEGYGYLWWVTNVNGYSSYFAGGYGGQYIYIVPDLDLIVVTTSSPFTAHRENRDIIEKFIIPSINNI